MNSSGLSTKIRLPKIFKIILFEDSRKVAFGIWGFIAGTFLVYFDKIPNYQWLECFALCSVLVGGGTLMDKWLNIKGNSDANAATKTNPPL